MKQRPRQIVALGGGGFSMESGDPLLDDYLLGLAGALCWFAGAVTPRCTPSAPRTPLPEAMSTPVAA